MERLKISDVERRRKDKINKDSLTIFKKSLTALAEEAQIKTGETKDRQMTGRLAQIVM